MILLYPENLEPSGREWVPEKNSYLPLFTRSASLGGGARCFECRTACPAQPQAAPEAWTCKITEKNLSEGIIWLSRSGRESKTDFIWLAFCRVLASLMFLKRSNHMPILIHCGQHNQSLFAMAIVRGINGSATRNHCVAGDEA